MCRGRGGPRIHLQAALPTWPFPAQPSRTEQDGEVCPGLDVIARVRGIHVGERGVGGFTGAPAHGDADAVHNFDFDARDCGVRRVMVGGYVVLVLSVDARDPVGPVDLNPPLRICSGIEA